MTNENTNTHTHLNHCIIEIHEKSFNARIISIHRCRQSANHFIHFCMFKKSTHKRTSDVLMTFRVPKNHTHINHRRWIRSSLPLISNISWVGNRTGFPFSFCDPTTNTLSHINSARTEHVLYSKFTFVSRFLGVIYHWMYRMSKWTSLSSRDSRKAHTLKPNQTHFIHFYLKNIDTNFMNIVELEDPYALRYALENISKELILINRLHKYVLWVHGKKDFTPKNSSREIAVCFCHLNWNLDMENRLYPHRFRLNLTQTLCTTIYSLFHRNPFEGSRSHGNSNEHNSFFFYKYT